MNGKCLEIGTIQAFLDGETAPENSAAITDHIGSCDKCASALASADEQSSIVFSALDREFNSLVPTQRLWTRIEDTIAVEKSRRPWWQRLAAGFVLPFASPTFAAAGGLVIMLGAFTLFSTLRNGTVGPADEMASADAPKISTNAPQAASSRAVDAVDAVSNTPSFAPEAIKASVKRSNVSPEKLKKLVTNAAFVTQQSSGPRYENASVTPSSNYLPGEESYVKTIEQLDRTVAGQKDRTLSPSSRVAFERDMAVVDDSISRMQRAVRKNPRNQSAKQVLYSAYQDKIDLLNSVAQRDELMASLDIR